MREASLRRSKLILWFACLFLSALGSAFVVSPSGQLVLEVNSLKALLASALVALLSWRALIKQSPSFNPAAALLSCFFALATVLGMQIDATGSLGADEIIIFDSSSGSSLAIAASFAVMSVGYALLSYFALSWAFDKLMLLSMKKRNAPVAIRGWKLTYPLCIGILLIAWLPYVIALFPGGVTADASRHLAQFFGVGGLELDTHFPYLEALLYGTLYELSLGIDPSGYLGVFSMELVQIALGVFVFSTIIMELDKRGYPKPLVLGSLAFFALFPLIPVYIVSIGKDSVHALLFALFAVQLMALSGPSSSPNRKQPCALSLPALFLTATLIALFRNGSILIVVIALIAACLAKRDIKLGAIGACVATAFCCFQFILVPLAGVVNEGPREMLSMPAQVIASQSAEELEAEAAQDDSVAALFNRPLEALPDLYEPFLSDPVKDALVVETGSDAMALVRASLDAIAKDPVARIGAALATTYGYWYPFYIGTYFIEDAPYFCEGGHDWSQPEWFASVDDLAQRESNLKPLQAVLHFMHFTPLLSLLYSPAAYLWLILFILGFSAYAKSNQRQALLVAIPFVMLTLILIAGPCSSLRYALPCVFSLPVLVAVLLGCLPSKGEAQPRLRNAS